MLKLLGATMLLGTTSTVSFTNNIVNKIQNNNIIKYVNDDNVIDLSTIMLDEINVNIYDLANQNSVVNQPLLFKQIIAEEIKQNSDQKSNLNTILVDFINNENDWAFIEFPINYPELGVTEQYNISVLYIGEGKFSNELSFSIKLENIDKTDKKDLSDIFTQTDLGNLYESGFANKENYVWSKIIDANPDVDSEIDVEDINFFDIEYNLTEIKAKAGSIYKGDVTFTYETNFDTIVSISTDTARMDKYSGSNEDSESAILDFAPNLGRSCFLNLYSKLNYDYIGHTYDNEDGTDVITMNSENTGNKVWHTTVSLQDIDLKGDQSQFQVTYRNYSNVNWMKTISNIYTKWIDNTFEIKLEVIASAYASAWNAYWARSEIQFMMNNFKFLS